MICPSSRLLIGPIIAGLCFFQGVAAEGASRAEELLLRYRAFVDGQRTIRFDSLSKMYQKGGPFPDWTWTKTFRSSFARVGDRWRLLVHEAGFSYLKRPWPIHLESEDVFDGTNYLEVIRDDREVRDLPSMDEESAMKRLEAGAHKTVRMDVAAQLEKPESVDAYTTREETEFLYGYIAADNLFVQDLLREKGTRLGVREDTIDDRPCDVLEAATAHGTVTLWLDPAADYAPLRMRVWKGGNDLMAKTPMRLQKARNSGGEKPDPPIRQYELQFDFQQRPIGGRVATVGYVRTERRVYEGGPELAIRKEAKLDHIRFDPKPEDVEPTLPIPEETRVHISNAPALQAKWSGGKLVLDYDKPTVASLKADWVSEQSSTILWRRPLVLATAIVLALSAGVLAWRRFSKATA